MKGTPKVGTRKIPKVGLKEKDKMKDTKRNVK